MISVKEERKKRGLSQVFLAKQLSISREYLSRIENYRVEPSEKVLEKINFYFRIGEDENASDKKVIY